MSQVTRRIRWLRRHFPEAIRNPVLDIGCGDFVHLTSFAPGSIGMDGRELTPPVGYHFVRWNFDEDIADRLRASGQPMRFKTILCNDVIEHVLAPHLLLLNLRRALADDGLLFLGVPLVNPLAFPRLQTRSNVFNYFCGFLSQDHLNFFSFQTFRRTVEFAGFDCAGWYSPFLPFRRPPMSGFEPVTVLALRKIADWNYGPKAFKRLDAGGHLVWKPGVDR